MEVKPTSALRTGRPPIPLEESQETIERFIRDQALSLLLKLEPNPKMRKPRTDMFKTKIVRAATKLPVLVANATCPRVIRIHDFKSSQKPKYEKAFKRLFEVFWTLKLRQNNFSGSPQLRHFIDFIGLHFPEEKVRAFGTPELSEHVEKVLF